MSGRKIKLGIIGCGYIGQKHLQSALKTPWIEVVAIADLNEQLVRKIAEQYHVGTFYASPKELITSPNVEAVVFAIPVGGRAELALLAFSSGKHALLEKPIGMSAQEVRQLIAAKGNLVAASCSSRHGRFLNHVDTVTEFIKSGALGEIRILRARWIRALGKLLESDPPAWRYKRQVNGGGILSNLGSYDLDYLLGLTDWSLIPRNVLGQTWSSVADLEGYVAPGSDAETHGIALIQCEGGTVISLERGEYVGADSEQVWEIIGSKGSLSLAIMAQSVYFKSIRFKELVPGEGVVTRTIWEGDEDTDIINKGPVQDFTRAILEGRDPVTTLEKALQIQLILDAIYTSSERNEAVKIEL